MTCETQNYRQFEAKGGGIKQGYIRPHSVVADWFLLMILKLLNLSIYPLIDERTVASFLIFSKRGPN